jgi:hypothetical protein
MTLRKHKYKQRLKELENLVAVEAARAGVRRDKAKTATEKAYHDGQRDAYSLVVQEMTRREQERQETDEQQRVYINEQKTEKRKRRDERMVWCVECLYICRFGEAYIDRATPLTCPNCKSNDVRLGEGPDNER